MYKNVFNKVISTKQLKLFFGKNIFFCIGLVLFCGVFIGLFGILMQMYFLLKFVLHRNFYIFCAKILFNCKSLKVFKVPSYLIVKCCVPQWITAKKCFKCFCSKIPQIR